jgi:hypothetical protein
MPNIPGSREMPHDRGASKITSMAAAPLQKWRLGWHSAFDTIQHLMDCGRSRWFSSFQITAAFLYSTKVILVSIYSSF